jgi:hypothetical protein
MHRIILNQGRGLQILSLAALALFSAAHSARALSLALVASDSVNASQVQASMMATGDFTSVTYIDAASAAPSLATLSSYDAVLSWTDYPAGDPVGLGNVLASYYDLGGKSLTIATYAFSNGWTIQGSVMSGNYLGLTLGPTGTVADAIVPTVPNDPIFNGVNTSAVQFYTNFNYSHPGLAPGATLLATDGAGNDMIARSANGVIDINAFPGNNGNAAFYQLLGRTLVQNDPPIPEPSTALFGLAVMGVCGVSRRRRMAPTATANPR